MPAGAEEVGLEAGLPAGQEAGPGGQLCGAPSDAGVSGLQGPTTRWGSGLHTGRNPNAMQHRVQVREFIGEGAGQREGYSIGRAAPHPQWGLFLELRLT